MPRSMPSSRRVADRCRSAQRMRSDERTERVGQEAGRMDLVYGDVNLNLIDGSAIWAPAAVEVLLRAGCGVTLLP